ncbi:hypothetical protein GCM10009804_04030 [Kribbella hippodromi]|uniref:HTH luxR-type domain-containing protein n=1 Tax=Kribbella hippodromi TaxID=434347 RepID=A0ABP4MUV5_9ACTN
MQTRSPRAVGRDREIEQLQHLLTAARGGRGGAVFLAGEPGIGKTRLAELTTSTAAEAGLLTLRGRVGTIGSTVAFRPFTEALLTLTRRGELPGTSDLGAYRQVLARLIPDWDDGTAHATDPSPVLLGEAVLRLLSLVSAGRGCLLVLEDLHGSDPETLAIVEYMLDQLAEQPIALVATLRQEPCPAYDLATQAAQSGAAALIKLQPLDRAEVAEMAAACLAVPVAAVQGQLADRLWRDSAGIPFAVEELLQDADGPTQVVNRLPTKVPAAVVRSVNHRADQLGAQARDLLVMAAVIGHRFPLSVVRRASGCDEETLLSAVRAGLAKQLVEPDEPEPDWYAFRHPLTAEALLAGLTPIERSALATRCADAIEELHPELPDEWCQLTAELAVTSGDKARAGRLFAMAGERAFQARSVASAIRLLERADELLTDEPDPTCRAEALRSLLPALSVAGRFDSRGQHAATIEALAARNLDSRRLAALHVGLAMIDQMAGHLPAALDEIAIARSLLGPAAADEDLAPVDVLATQLELARDSPDRVRTATRLAVRAAAAAERAKLPAVGAEALQMLGILARENDAGLSIEYFDRARQLADEHGMVLSRMISLMLQAGTICLATGSVVELEYARQQAVRIGALPIADEMDGILSQQAVLRAEYARAAELIENCLDATGKFRIGRMTTYFLTTKAILEAHQGHRTEMEATLAEAVGRSAYELPYCYGLARTFCALLEENRELAEADLAQALEYQANNPTTFHLVGKNGLSLLLGVLAGRSGWDHFKTVTATAAGGMRWNKQFVQLAHAVLLGRDGQAEQANAKLLEALETSSLFPMAQHLGLRLVAEPAYADGWGEPVAWLRQAEDYFHQADVPAVASACRSLLRQFGATVPQRRSGSEQVPGALRQLGITTREYEVCRLLVDRVSNKTIAARLHISPRTVEKHVASLMTKTGQPDREALSSFARSTLADGNTLAEPLE